MKEIAKFIRSGCFSLMLLSGLESAAAAEAEFPIGNSSLKITPADGFCVIDPKFTFDKNWLEWQSKIHAGVNELIGATALCDELEALREGTPINFSRWTILLAPTQGKEKSSAIPGINRRQLLGIMEKEFKKGVDVDADAIAEKSSKALQDTTGDDNPIIIREFNKPEFLKKSAYAVYGGLTMQIEFDDTQQNVGGVFGMTLVKQHIVSINNYRDFDAPNTINLLLDETQQLMGDLVANN